MTGSLAYSGDAPQLPWLLYVSDRYFDIERELADGADLSQKNIKAIVDLGAEARIPFSETSVYHSPRDRGRAIVEWRAAVLRRASGGVRRGLQRAKQRGVHQLRREETQGSITRSKHPTARVNEVLARAVAYNITRVIHTRYNSDIEP